MISEFMKKYLEDKRQLDQGYISHREFDRRSGYEKRGKVTDDPEWQRFFDKYTEILLGCYQELDKTK